MPTSLQAIAQKAKEDKPPRFGSLYQLLNADLLRDCWGDIRKDAATGVDRVSAREYEQNLETNIANLVERLKRKTYRAKLVRRQYIPKGDGRFRPLGIPATEDKLLQRAVTRILEAIYEQDFLRCSYGYRPEIGALDAVGDLSRMLQFGRYGFVVEADIQSYFDWASGYSYQKRKLLSLPAWSWRNSFRVSGRFGKRYKPVVLSLAIWMVPL